MKNFVFHNPTTIHFGAGQINNIGPLAAAIGRKILIVTGGKSVVKSGLLDSVTEKIEEAGGETFILSGVVPNPEIESVRHGAAMCKDNGIEAVLALGGGSVIDAAKTIAAGAVYDGDPWDFLDKKIKPENPLPVMTVLTLAATGSEANGNAVITNPEIKEKRAFYHPQLYPKFSILDPELTYTVPPDQTAYGAVDIMAHVFEQYFHDIEGTDIQDAMCEAILKAVIKNAPAAVRSPEDYTARANLMWSSSLALNGLIGAGAQGDWTCHIMEHELSAKYGIAHGAGLAVVYCAWMPHVLKRKTAKLAQYSVNVWGVDPAGKSEADTAVEGIGKTRSFFRDTLDVGVTLKDYGIGTDRIEEMARGVVDQKGGEKNLGGLSADDLVEIFGAAV